MTDTVPITVTPEVLAQLQTPTPASARKTRQGPKAHGGDCTKNYGVCSQPHKDLTYVDARYVQGVLDSEVGPGNWQSEFIVGAGGKVACRIGIFVAERGWVFKGDGAGETDIEGEKGSFSDAFKRAGVAWGIARDLYGEDAPAAVPQQTSFPNTNQTVSPQPVAVQPERPPLPPNTVPYQDFNVDAGGHCPAGHGPWTIKPAGTSKAGKAYRAFWKCDGKTPDGRYCDEKPSKAWVDAHPIAS